jgi:hypothetical protein
MAERAKLPAPTWIPINKATLASWRSGPAESQPTLSADGEAQPERDLCIVRFANVTVAAVQSAVADVDGAKVVGMGAPRAIAKGQTPQGGPADAPPIDSMSPGVSPSTRTNDPPMPPPLESSPGGGMPAMSLPPALSETLIQSSALQCIVLRDPKVAAEIVKKIQKTCENGVSETLVRPYPATCTVVLKGVPLSIKHDRLWHELSSLQSAVPSYLRFHRNDRGLFKNVVYVKFASPVDAELGRLELERFSVSGRPLKVELKKPKPTTVEESARAEAARREDLKVALISALDSYAAELIKSTENEGFSLPKNAISKDDQKYLRGICQANEFSMDIGAAVITVKKRINKSVSPGAGPARTPPFNPATPSTHAADAAEIAGMQFRGIRHWREQRAGISGQQAPLGLHRPLGPSDGVAPWGTGRGRPVT